MTWEIFYNKIINDAMYIVHSSRRVVKIYDNIQEAYNYLDDTNVGYDFAFITLLFKDEILKDHSFRKIFDYLRPVPGILDYPKLPALKISHKDLFYYQSIISNHYPGSKSYTTEQEAIDLKFFGVFDYKDIILHNLRTYKPDYVLPYSYSYHNSYIVFSLNNSTGKYDTYYDTDYGYEREGYIENKNVLVLMLDESLFGKPLRFIKYILPYDEYEPRELYYARKDIIQLYQGNKIGKFYKENRFGDYTEEGEIYRIYKPFRRRFFW